MIHDDVSTHLGEAGSFDRAALPLGVYLAWCANHHLLSGALCADVPDLLTRVRYRDVSGSELAVAGCGGRLGDEHLNAEGQAFTRQHYRIYLENFHRTRAEDPWGADDHWSLYDRLAPDLTRALMATRGNLRRGSMSSGRRRWWQLWK